MSRTVVFSNREWAQLYRAERARGGWFNWYVNRGLIAMSEPEASKDMRQHSWRRKL